MKDKIKIYITLIVCSTFLWSCNNDNDQEPVNNGEEDRQTIQLVTSSSGIDESSVGLRSAVTNLIGAGDIGVIGALYTEGAPIVWTSYPDLDNVKAHAVGVSGGIYSFDWDTQKYWPFDGTQLVFMAYYPYTSNAVGSHVNISGPRENLSLTLPQTTWGDMPDVMYASGNFDTETRPLNKQVLDGKVDLGEFTHVLSQLTVEVVRKDNNVDPALMVYDLTVSTNATTGSLSLRNGDLYVSDGLASSYRFIDTPVLLTSFPAGGFTSFFYPGTEDDVQVEIVIGKSPTSVTRSYPVSAFRNVNDENLGVTLERAKRTTLRLEIAGIPVQDGAQLNLKATLSEWDQRGDFVVNVK